MTNSPILVVEDDPHMQRLLQTQLSMRGFSVNVVATGPEALDAVAEEEPLLVLLDIRLPDMDGIEVCRRLREWSSVPIILLTAADQPKTKITALELGADDYLTKPFHMGELVARIHAVLRRTISRESPITLIEANGLTIDLAKREVHGPEGPVHLTRLEFDLLQTLVTHADKVLTYQYLLETVWGSGYTDNRTVHVHVCNLRRKIERGPFGPRYIIAVPGVGYRFRFNE
ncbi:MAG TPA: response regulator transcription factor [Chthonomonadales bacterium]|nr:response regulator transcription factor [Chthonomonadales bacterium]